MHKGPPFTQGDAVFTIRPADFSRRLAAAFQAPAARLLAFVTVLALMAGLGPAQAVPIQVTLSPDQLTNQPETDRWVWGFSQLPPPSMPANGTLQLDFTFDGGFLRLHDQGGAPDLAQLNHRNGLLTRLATQQASRAQVEAEIAGLNAQLDGLQTQRAGLLGQVQASEAELVEVQAELTAAKQAVQTLETEKTSISTALDAAEAERDSLADQIAGFIGDIFGDAFKAIQDAFNAAVETIAQLSQEMASVNQQIISAQGNVTQRQGEANAVSAQTAILGTALETLDNAIALLDSEKADAEKRHTVLTTLISVTDQELAQLPEDTNAEGLQLSIDGPSGNPIPLFGQLLLDVAAGDAAWTSPFFQGVFENASSQHLAYADITPSFVDLAGFTLQLDLFGPPGEGFSLYGLTFELLADEISIVSRAGAMPVPEPATIALLGGGLLGLGWLRRQSRRRDQLRMA